MEENLCVVTSKRRALYNTGGKAKHMAAERKDTGIDPRVKLLQILLFGMMLFFLHTNIGNTLQIAVLIGFLIFLRLPVCGLRLALYYGGLSLLDQLLSGAAQYKIVAAITLIIFLLRKFSSIMGIYYLFIRAMTVGELLSALGALRVPQKIIIPLAVTLRFFPTILQEVSIIRDVLRLRGRPLTFLSFCHRPMEMLEYVFVPFMMRCVRIADELSAAAVARGIENPAKHTAMFPLKFRWQDGVYFTVLIGSSAALIAYEALL